MTPEEYEAATDQLRLTAYRAGYLYARVRQFRALRVVPAIIEHEQRRLDVLADQVTDLVKKIIDHEMAEDDREPYLAPLLAGTLRADDAIRRLQRGIWNTRAASPADVRDGVGE